MVFFIALLSKNIYIWLMDLNTTHRFYLELGDAFANASLLLRVAR